MASTPVADDARADERKRLAGLFSRLRDLFDRLMVEDNLLYSDAVLRLLVPAWTELKAADHFETIRRTIEDGEIDVQLQAHALFGAQGALKTEVGSQELARVEHDLDHGKGGRRTKEQLDRALEWVDVPLGTFAAIPGPVGIAADVVKEFKEGAKAALRHPAGIVKAFKRVGVRTKKGLSRILPRGDEVRA
jgi:hypothetical protein